MQNKAKPEAMIPFSVTISERDCMRLEKVAQESGTTIEQCIQMAVHNQMAKVREVR